MPELDLSGLREYGFWGTILRIFIPGYSMFAGMWENLSTSFSEMSTVVVEVAGEQTRGSVVEPTAVQELATVEAASSQEELTAVQELATVEAASSQEEAAPDLKEAAPEPSGSKSSPAVEGEENV